MDKKALVEKLQKEGYSVTLEGNVPMFALSESVSIENIKEVLKEYDYVASFGYRKSTNSGTKLEKTPKKQNFQTEEDGQYSLF